MSRDTGDVNLLPQVFEELQIVALSLGVFPRDGEQLDGYLGRLLEQAEIYRRARGTSPFKLVEYFRGKFEDGWATEDLVS